MIYLDFDGTVADVWKRYHKAFAVAAGIPQLTFEEYFVLKRALVKDASIAESLGIVLPDSYFTVKGRLLEERDFLALDELLLPREKLLEFFDIHSARILTVRRRKENLFWEMARMGLKELWQNTIVLDPCEDVGKKRFMRESLSGNEHCMVGDSEAEAETADLDNVQVYLVRTGLRNVDLFPPKENIHVINDILEFIAAAERRGSERFCCGDENTGKVMKK